MGKRWGVTLAVWCALAGLAAACSSSTSSQGVVSTTAAAETTAPSEPSATSASGSGDPASPSTADTTAAEPAAAGGTVTVGLDSEPPTLDPAANSISLANGSVFAAIYETLFRITPDELTPQPVLAESITEAGDRMSWTLVVRDGITFHDGTAFDAAAVKFNLDRQKASPYNGAALTPLVGVDVVDEMTVQLNLSGPWTALPNVLAGITGVMVSPAAAADATAYQRNPVGTGPYRFVEWASGDRIVTERNDSYWGDPAPLDSLVFKIITVEAARVAAFEAGEIDAYTTIVDATAEDAAAAGAQVVAPPPTGYGYYYLNLTRPPLDDVRVRRALSLGADRDAIANAYQGQTYEEASFSPFLKDSEWWVAPETPVTFDPEQASALLADYGQPVQFTFKLLAGSQEIEDAVRATIDYWNQLGMDVELQLIPDVGSYVTDVVTGNYDVLGFVGGSLGDPDTVLYHIFHSTGSYNFGRYSSPAVDAALDQGRASNDDAERKAAYASVQQAIREDLPVIITSHGQIYIVASPELGGLDPSFFFPSRTVSRG